MKFLWQKITAIKGWFLVVPVVAVAAWVVCRFFGRGLFRQRDEGPKPMRYITPEEEASAAERIRDHRDRRREEDKLRVAGAREELDNFLDGDGE